MATLQLADKFSPVVDKAFAIKSKTEGTFSTKYDFDGVDAVKIYNFPTVALTDYVRPEQGVAVGATVGFVPTGAASSVQTKTLTQDKKFSQLFDGRDLLSTAGALKVGEWLRDQIDLEVTPVIDKYRIATFAGAVQAANKVSLANAAALTKDVAYENFLKINEKMSDAGVPETKRYAFMAQSVYNLFKLGGFVTNSDDGYADKQSGVVRNIDGVEIKIVPTSYLPAKTAIVIWQKESVIAPKKLSVFDIVKKSERYHGQLVNGRVVHDAFVLDKKNLGLGSLVFSA